jgi:hypothetical protein
VSESVEEDGNYSSNEIEGVDTNSYDFIEGNHQISSKKLRRTPPTYIKGVEGNSYDLHRRIFH